MLRITTIFCFVSLFASACWGDGWQAGTARSEITPEQPMRMSGYASRDRPAEGKLTDLWAKALVLRDAKGHTGVLITLDLIGVHRSTAAEITRRLSESHDLEREQIAINCSHTHSGPAVGKNLGPLHYLSIPEPQQALLDEYESELIDAVSQCVEQAFAEVRPASLTWGSGLCTVAVNRRNNDQNNVPQLRRQGLLQGPYDHDVPVLIVRDQQAEPMAIVFGYACHATVLSFYQWSGDYPGFAQIALEERYPGTNAMFWAGCGADQNPLPRHEVEMAKSYGGRLAAAVAEVVEGTTRPVEASLVTRYREIGLPLENLPTVEALRQMVTAGEKVSGYERARAAYLLDPNAEHEHLNADGELADSYPYPVQTWRLGEQIHFVLLGGEVVVDYALRLKSLANELADERSKSIWVAGYSNDVMAYIPSRRVLNEGGYEAGGSNVYYGLPGAWSPEIENQIVDEVRQQLDR